MNAENGGMASRPPAGSAGKVAVIGLGAMGMGMACSLLRAGFDVAGFDISDDAVAHFAEKGGRAARTPAEAVASASVVVAVVVNAAQTEAILFGPDGCAEAMQPGTVFVASATMAPDVVRALAARLEPMGALYLDAPMSGGVARAAEGKLTMLASGSSAAFEAARPALSAMTERLYELGDLPGQGAAFKMVNQLLAGVHIAAASEAMAFAARQGLDLARVYDVITKSAGNSWMFENRMPHVLEGDYSPKSAVSIFTKDLGIVLDMARGANFPVPIASAALQMFLMTASAGMAADDDSSVTRLYARLAGLSLPGDAS
jgi:3-hydroxyisobutyrate dehydrogenase